MLTLATSVWSFGEELSSLDSFENTKGWGLIDTVSLDTANEKQLKVSGSTGSIINNGAAKQVAQYLKTKSVWGDHEITAEFMIPKGSNSGFYVQGRYEVQVYDSFGQANPTQTDMGGIYQRWDDARNKKGLSPGYEGVKPLKNMAKKPGEWNQITIQFKAPRFNEYKEKVSHAQFVEVRLNGEVVQKNTEAKGPTRSHPEKLETTEGPLYIQGDHGPVAIRNLRIVKKDFSSVPSKEVSAVERAPLAPNGQPLVELVVKGREAFAGKGCIECHAVSANDTAIKTGPSLYGLFQKKPIEHHVVDGYEKHDQIVTADEKYLVSSVRSSLIQLAKNKAGEAYLPIMPSYSEKIVSNTELRGIYAYLKTLNAPEQAGPPKVYEVAEKELPYDPDLDPQAVHTYDGSKVVRALVKNGTSARGIHVGLENGQNYAFDPMTLSIRAIWTGRFLDMREEVNGRGGKHNEVGEAAKMLPYPYQNFMRPLLKDGKGFDTALLNSIPAKVEFSEGAFTDKLAQIKGKLLSYTQEKVPVIRYEIDENKVAVQFFITPEGTLEAKVSGEFKTPQTLTFPLYALKSVEVSGGTLDEAKGHWTLPAGSAEYSWKGIPLKPLVAKQQTRPAVVAPCPVTWEANVAGGDIETGYQLESADGPVYSTGFSPLFEPTAIDFDEDGTPYIGSRAAGIWTIKNGQWQPFALGTYDVLGLTVVGKGEVVICQKPEVSRIKDTDGDGKADLFETLSDDYFFGGNYHAYNHGPAVAKDGSIHFNLNLQHVYSKKTFNAGGAYMGSMGGFRGWSLRLDPSGKFETYASGLRSPAGIAFSPKDELYYTDNQGEFMGTSKLFRLKKDGYYGHPSGLVDAIGYTPERITKESEALLAKREKAAVLLPHNLVANSPGHPVWDTTEGGKFGPFAGQIFVGDQTLSNIHRVSLETVNGVEQGSVMPFVDKLPSGPMRLSFSPEGELWVGQTGRGWASRGGELSALQKITWTGKESPRSLHRIEVRKNGFELFFTKPMANYEQGSLKYMALDSWYYLDSAAYGSKEEGKRAEKVSKLVWSEDGSSVIVEVENFPALLRATDKAGNTARVIRFNLTSTEFGKGKTPFHCFGYYTLNEIPK